VTIILLLFGTTTLVQAFVIPTGSMEDTLLIGDHLLVDKLSYAPGGAVSAHLLPYREPKHGDIIVFRYPVDIKQTFVKRVIGVPGDRIRLVNKQVYRNGEKLYEPYTFYKTDFIDPYRDNFPSVPPSEMYNVRNEKWTQELPSYIQGGDIVVPPDSYFAMGDNRDVSYDSRYWGFIPRKNVIGRPMFIYWSFVTPPDQYQMRSAGDRLGFLAHIIIHFFDETRWPRTLRIVR